MNTTRWILSVIIAIIVILTPILIYQHYAHTEVRAALDIGSGSTNLLIARVNTRTNKIISQLYNRSIPVPYQKHLEKSGNNTFDAEVMDAGIKAIKTLKEDAEAHHVKKVVAVATAAFRAAENSPQFVKDIEQQTGVSVRVISQDEEGILAFRGALALTPVKPQNAITWDIGGGSMQLTTLTDQGTYLVEKGKTASIPFKNAIIDEIEMKDSKTIHSPNPMSEETINKAINYAMQKAKETNPFIQKKLNQPHIQIYAVGSLFNKGIYPLVKDKKVTQEELAKAIKPLGNKKDSELPGGPLAEVAVSNPVLVLGYMKGLNLDHVDIIDINNADGALTYPPYWSE